MKLHQGSAGLCQRLWNKALDTVSASCIEGHVKGFRSFCPENVYISMVVAYTMTSSRYLNPVRVPGIDANGVQQVVIRVSDKNFGHIFPKNHVILKNAGKRAARDIDIDDEGHSKKARTTLWL
ncbi:hypothetical protein DFQ26_007968 [Actinomortierella ambigua]|nr:hypothetical protein DFQ26_007968 [Actinomortierella ambigua]